ncbi:MAG TPA: flagellar filament capping protein FliD, partial [Terriglobales bacterium]|nr:flagellar filament capping protein FliD [Terriglobales bacterium]
GPDTGRAKQALADFVTAYNSVISALNGQFTVNAATKTAGVLAGDSTIRGLQSTLLAAASYTVPDNGDFQNLRAIGIEMQNDGTLSINDPVLDDVMTAHYADFQRFFQDSTSGFARRVGTDMMTINDSVSGPIAVDLKGVEASSESISDQIDDFEVRIANRETQLLDQYSRLDAMLRQMPLLQSQLTAQLNSLNQK